MFKNLFSKLKPQVAFNPVFLIGCGRSGTTILGNTIGQHPDITYLNERRDLWHKAYPELDIQTGWVENPKLTLTPNDIDQEKSNILTQLFHQEQNKERTAILLEKLPINNFRLQFIDAIYPNAKYIYLQRNGLEVATSISKKADVKPWFGRKNQKWEMLFELAQQNIKNLPEKEFSNFEKGLIEWNLSISASETFFSNLDHNKFFSLSYQSFMENPELQIHSIYSFLGLEGNDGFIKSITQDISRKTKSLNHLSNELRLLGGEFLEKSVNNQMRQTVISK